MEAILVSYYQQFHTISHGNFCFIYHELCKEKLSGRKTRPVQSACLYMMTGAAKKIVYLYSNLFSASPYKYFGAIAQKSISILRIQIYWSFYALLAAKILYSTDYCLNKVKNKFNTLHVLCVTCKFKSAKDYSTHSNIISKLLSSSKKNSIN